MLAGAAAARMAGPGREGVVAAAAAVLVIAAPDGQRPGIGQQAGDFGIKVAGQRPQFGKVLLRVTGEPVSRRLCGVELEQYAADTTEPAQQHAPLRRNGCHAWIVSL